jgi:hypothetical protein
MCLSPKWGRNSKLAKRWLFSQRGPKNDEVNHPLSPLPLPFLTLFQGTTHISIAIARSAGIDAGNVRRLLLDPWIASDSRNALEN